MAKVMLSLHVLASVIFIGPITVAASLFPRYARQGLAEGADSGAVGVSRLLHRISRGYAVFGLSVPLFGIATAVGLGVLGQTWLVVAIVLTAAAGVLLAVAILPTQQLLLERLIGEPTDGCPDGPETPTALSRLRMLTGVFALAWAVVVVLMVFRPGSTTGV